jgi:hypothetical protein
VLLAEAAGAGAVLIFDTAPFQVTAILAVPGPFENPRSWVRGVTKSATKTSQCFEGPVLANSTLASLAFLPSFAADFGRIPGYLISRSQGEELLKRLDPCNRIQIFRTSFPTALEFLRVIILYMRAQCLAIGVQALTLFQSVSEKHRSCLAFNSGWWRRDPNPVQLECCRCVV